MIFEVKRGRQCDSLAQFQANEIHKGLAVEISLTNELHGAREQIETMFEAINYRGEQLWEKDMQIDVQKQLTEHEKDQKNKWKLTTFILIVFDVVLVLVAL